MPSGRSVFSKRGLTSLAAIQGRPEAALTKELTEVAQGLNLGRAIGRQWVLSATEIETLTAYAKRVMGWDPQSDLDGDDRTDSPVTDEKLGGRKAYHRMVMIREWGDARPGARIVPLDALADLSFDSVLLVENAAVMLHFPRLNVQWPDGLGHPLVLYRGDKQFSPKWPAKWLKTHDKPVDTVPDLDPAGLVIAAKYPRLRHLILPAEDELPRTARINHERFLGQIAELGRACPAPKHAQISRWWGYLLRTESAIPQESWLTATSPTRQIQK